MTQTKNYYWRIAGFYFFYYAFIGMFAPYWSLYLQSIHFNAIEIAILMSVQPVMRVLAPTIWGFATDGVLDACLALQTLGIRIVIVHGGGKPIDRAMAEAGLSPKKVSGIRYTDDATLGIVVDVLLEINAGLRTALASKGGIVGGFVGEPDVWPIRGERLLLPGLDLQPIDLGHVGKVVRVDDAIKDHLAFGAVPILQTWPSDLTAAG